MATRFQACALVAQPMYPNAIAWSEENLIAVASGHIVTILNPALPCVLRGLITMPAPKPFEIGVIERKELSAPGMLPICLSRCLIAVSTIEGQVKIYRSPYLEFQAKWVEVIDVKLLFNNLSKVGFKESYTFNSEVPYPCQMQAQDDNLPLRISQKRIRNDDSEPLGEINKFFKPVELLVSSQHVRSGNGNAGRPLFAEESISNVSQTAIIPWHNIDETDPNMVNPQKPKKKKKGDQEKNPRESRLKSRFLHAHNAWITAVSWVTLDVYPSEDQVFLVTDSAAGSVKVWFQRKSEPTSFEDGLVPFNLATEIIAEDCSPVSTLSVVVPAKSLDTALIAVGKGSGSFEVWTCDLLLKIVDKIGTYNTHDHVITGLAWAFGGHCLYSCSQDNSIRWWILRGGSLCEAVFPSNTLGISSSKNQFLLAIWFSQRYAL